MKLENELKDRYDELGVRRYKRKSIQDYLNMIREHHVPTYEHSVRVGLLSSRIAEYVDGDRFALLYSGLLHDVGKTFIEISLLDKKDVLTKKEFEDIKPHVMLGYDILKDAHAFSAEIAVRHHRYGKMPYPEKLPESPIVANHKNLKIIEIWSRLLALADFYDALTTRTDNKFDAGLEKNMTVKEVLFYTYPQKKLLIQELFDNGILKEKLT